MSSAFGNGLATLWLACRKALIFSAVYAHRGAFNRFFTRNGVSWISTSENREWCFGFFFTSGEHTLALPHGHGSKFHEHRYTHHLRVMKNQQRVISWSTWWMLSQVNMYIYVYVYTIYKYNIDYCSPLSYFVILILFQTTTWIDGTYPGLVLKELKNCLALQFGSVFLVKLPFSVYIYIYNYMIHR